MTVTRTDVPVDPELLAGFLDEADESLAELEPRFVELETSDDPASSIDTIFRAVHSVKGNSGFFGLGRIKVFSHEMETLLDDLRKGRLGISSTITNVLLAGVDELKTMIARVRDGEEETADPVALDRLTERIRQVGTESGADIEAARSEFVTEVQGLVTAIDNDHVLSAFPILKSSLDRVGACLGRLRHFIEENNGKDHASESAGQRYFMGDIDVTAEVLDMNALLALAPHAMPDTAEKLTEALDALADTLSGAAAESVRDMIEELGIFTQSAVGYDDLIRELLQEKFASLRQELFRQPENAGKPGEAEAKREKDETVSRGDTAKKKNAAKSMRVNEEKVDEFMKFVGELIISTESLNHFGKRLQTLGIDRRVFAEFQTVNTHLSELTHDLQRGLMEIRKVSIRGLLQKVPRMARDLARDAGKQVHVITEGDDLAIDKSLVEVLGDPLTHMVRNSIDHGIEPPKTREAAGKPADGTLTVSATEDGEWIRITVKDDGAGIAVDRVKAKAVEKGILDPGRAAAMTDEEAFQLLFAPGFSTAEQVTEVSGRGVGMDVVITNIRKANGQIEVHSSPGLGTEIVVSLPAAASVEVITGLVTCVGSERYILPLSSIKKSLKPDRDSLTRIAGGGEAILIRDTLYPLVRLHGTLGVRPHTNEIWDGMVLIVAEGGQSAALLVDELRTVQRVVVKSLGSQFKGISAIAGGAVLGDGRIGLVLDIEGLLNTALDHTGPAR